MTEVVPTVGSERELALAARILDRLIVPLLVRGALDLRAQEAVWLAWELAREIPPDAIVLRASGFVS